jgi:hypothetical protein
VNRTEHPSAASTVGAVTDIPPPPPGADGAPTPPPAPPPAPPQSNVAAALGPPGTSRSVGLVILVTIVTCGIWTLVWSYQNGEELKTHTRTGLGGVLYLIITLLISPITMFLMADEIEKMYQAAGKQSPVSALTGLWFLLPIIGNIVWYVKVQRALNAHWESLGAPPASGV